MKHCFAYLKYWWRHKKIVYAYCKQFGICWRGLTHDLSKLRPDEFFAHARYFFSEHGSLEELDKAFCRHVHRNPHHWNYWIIVDHFGVVKAVDMPVHYRKEMLADWLACGQTRGESAWTWYTKHRQTILLHANTRAWIEVMLSCLGGPKGNGSSR